VRNPGGLVPEQIKDYATGKLLRKTPEETVRQAFEHILIDELGYPREHIDIEVTIQRGSRRGNEEADIVVFHSAVHEQTNMYMVIETEAPGHAFDNQVFSYVTATTAEFAIWFDGLDKKKSRGAEYRWRDMQAAPTEFEIIPTIPQYGETLDEIGKYKKSQLKPTKSIRGLFQKMHNRLYGEGPLKREDSIAQEVIKLLFCKLYDELHMPGDTCQFRATFTELKSKHGRKRVGDRVRALFDSLQSDAAYREIFMDERLQYDDFWISYIVSELQPFSLSHDETDIEAMGDAYEIFIGPQLKGESGQFFTPRSIVKTVVEMLAPSMVRREAIIDPACGSGGFLTYALRSVQAEAQRYYPDRPASWISQRVKEYAGNFIFGLDLEPLLVKVAKSYMAIVGDGRGGIFRENALAPEESWQPATQQRLKAGTFDIIATNPPFGTKIKVESKEIVNQFDLGFVLEGGARSERQLKGGQDPAILFIERSWQLLKRPTGATSGGRMGIVLPRQILSGHDRAMVSLRRWILNHCRILAVIDLPPEAFQPYTGTITSVLFVERVDSPPDENYGVFMAVAQHVGHDRRGAPLVRRAEDGSPLYGEDNEPIVLDDLPLILDHYRAYKNGGSYNSSVPSVFSVSRSEIENQAGLRFDAWFHDPTKNEVVKKIWDLDGGKDIEVRTIGELIEDPDDVFYPGRHKRNYCTAGTNAVPFLSGTNILQVRPFGVKWQPKAYSEIRNHFVQEGMILVTRSGSTGRVIYVADELAGFSVADGVTVTEHVIRIKVDPMEVDPGYLFAVLANEELGHVLLAQGVYASVVQHITPEHIKAIPIPMPSFDIQKKIGDRVREAERQRTSANRAIRSAQDQILGEIGLELRGGAASPKES